MDSEIKKSVIVKAMKHYQSRLTNLKSDDEITLIITKNDIGKNLAEIDDVLKDFNQIAKTGEFSDYVRRVICLSLTSYINDLEISKVITREKIGNMNLSFEETDKEIQLANEIRDIHCPNDWNYIVD